MCEGGLFLVFSFDFFFPVMVVGVLDEFAITFTLPPCAPLCALSRYLLFRIMLRSAKVIFFRLPFPFPCFPPFPRIIFPFLLFPFLLWVVSCGLSRHLCALASLAASDPWLVFFRFLTFSWASVGQGPPPTPFFLPFSFWCFSPRCSDFFFSISGSRQW